MHSKDLALQPDRRLPIPPELSEEDGQALLDQLQQALSNQGMYFDVLPHAIEAMMEAIEMGIFRVGDSGALENRSSEVEISGWEVIGFGLPNDPSRNPEASVVAVWANPTPVEPYDSD